VDRFHEVPSRSLPLAALGALGFNGNIPIILLSGLLTYQRLCALGPEGSATLKTPLKKEYQTRSEEYSQDDPVENGLPYVFLDPPDEMDYTKHGSEVSQSVESFPAPEAKSPHRRVVGGNGERNQHQKGREAYEDELALRDVGNDLSPSETLVDPSVGGDVDQGITEPKEAEHPP
jgi:hypothetical protein